MLRLARVKLAAKDCREVRRLFWDSEAELDLSMKYVFHPISVQDWTYRHPILTATGDAEPNVNVDGGSATLS